MIVLSGRRSGTFQDGSFISCNCDRICSATCCAARVSWMAYGRVRMTGSARVPEFWLGWERVADRRKVGENWRAVAAMLLASDVGQPEAQEDLEYVQQFDIGLRQRLRLLPRQDLAAVRVREPVQHGRKSHSRGLVQLLHGSSLNEARTLARSPMPGTEPAAQ
ncbi:hypothetical protein [Mesorhizobium sp. J428]|uniref:hypothetical protein n=1 Tax=Mesorhizobium sp. J428 TaxID=2898440 RepID=UPI002150BE4E|nr:hypothetical protein [Mesorhizobium sp. J428]MCR5857988.1 hypothetical protein [Mesorhizobium sp. J428]